MQIALTNTVSPEYLALWDKHAIGYGDIKGCTNAYCLKDGRWLQMLRDEVLLKLIAPERRTASKLLFIPDSAKRMEYELYNGEVLACGPGAIRKKDGKRNPIEVKPGDKILFYWLSGETRLGTRLFDDRDELMIVSESSIQGIYA